MEIWALRLAELFWCVIVRGEEKFGSDLCSTEDFAQFLPTYLF